MGLPMATQAAEAATTLDTAESTVSSIARKPRLIVPQQELAALHQPRPCCHLQHHHLAERPLL